MNVQFTNSLDGHQSAGRNLHQRRERKMIEHAPFKIRTDEFSLPYLDGLIHVTESAATQQFAYLVIRYGVTQLRALGGVHYKYQLQPIFLDPPEIGEGKKKRNIRFFCPPFQWATQRLGMRAPSAWM